MKTLASALLLLWLLGAGLASAHSWILISPDHGQTFSYGSEQHRSWVKSEQGNMLTLLLNYTNDPYVDRSDPRQYDRFAFHFPEITLGQDDVTFYYHPAKGKAIPVALKKPDFLGVKEIHLTSYARVQVDLPHGEVTVRLIIFDRPIFSRPED